MIEFALSYLLPLMAGGAPTTGRYSLPNQEGVFDALLRFKDEHLWPRVPVRYAPPLDGNPADSA